MKRVCFYLDIDEDFQVFEYDDDASKEKINDDLCDWVTDHKAQLYGYWNEID